MRYGLRMVTVLARAASSAVPDALRAHGVVARLEGMESGLSTRCATHDLMRFEEDVKVEEVQALLSTACTAIRGLQSDAEGKEAVVEATVAELVSMLTNAGEGDGGGEMVQRLVEMLMSGKLTAHRLHCSGLLSALLRFLTTDST